MNIKSYFFSSLLVIIVLVTSCVGNSKINTLRNHKYFNPIKKLEEGMIGYMKDAGYPYTKRDVNDCINILVEYVNDMEQTKSKEEGMLLVKKSVLALNELNSKCGGGLIETGERDQIGEIMIGASADMGYNTMDEDVTWEWREW